MKKNWTTPKVTVLKVKETENMGRRPGGIGQPPSNGHKHNPPRSC